MADENANGDGDAANNADNGAGDGDGKNGEGNGDGGDGAGDGDGDDQTVSGKKYRQLQGALKESRDDNKKIRAELDGIKDQIKKGEEDKLAEQGKYKDLAESREKELEESQAKVKSLTERIEGFEKAVKESVETQLEKVENDDDKNIIKDALDGKSIEQQQTLLPKLLEKFAPDALKNVNASPKGDQKKGNIDKDTQISELTKKLDEAKKAKKPMDVLKYRNEINRIKASE